jgi:hypothetical protein
VLVMQVNFDVRHKNGLARLGRADATEETAGGLDHARTPKGQERLPISDPFWTHAALDLLSV